MTIGPAAATEFAPKPAPEEAEGLVPLNDAAARLGITPMRCDNG
jgi:hypothetical protein